MNDYSTHLCAKPLPFKNKAASTLDNQSRHAQNSLLFRYIQPKTFFKCQKENNGMIVVRRKPKKIIIAKLIISCIIIRKK